MNKDLIVNHKNIVNILCKIYNGINLKNKTLGKRYNDIQVSCSLKNNVKINIKGKNNCVIVKDFSRLRDVTISISGYNNKVIINEFCYIDKSTFAIEDDNNTIEIGRHTTINHDCEFSAIEGTNLIVGEDCLFSAYIDVRTGDSHSIVDLDGNRKNYSKDIRLGNHVWVARRVTFLKGAKIGNNIVVGANSLVNKEMIGNNLVLVGSPAKIAKKDINWLSQRIN